MRFRNWGSGSHVRCINQNGYADVLHLEIAIGHVPARFRRVVAVGLDSDAAAFGVGKGAILNGDVGDSAVDRAADGNLRVRKAP